MRKAEIKRKTRETDITVSLNLDGQGTADIATGIGFFDHMLTLLAKHGQLDLFIRAKGDLDTDDHHTVEDVGIVLGQAISCALENKKGICRFGHASVPMDEALASAVIDLSGRPWLVFQATFTGDRVGTFSTQSTEEFFRAVAMNAGLTLHVACPYGYNDHHKIEAMFKAFARCFAQAITINPALGDQILSTKGML
jgi:imidazoleglycerol-phosphate dehydratase